MSLRLDNAKSVEVKSVTDYKIINVNINAQTNDVTIVYEELSEDELIGVKTLLVNRPAVFASLKSQAYNFLINNLEVTGTVS